MVMMDKFVRDAKEVFQTRWFVALLANCVSMYISYLAINFLYNNQSFSPSATSEHVVVRTTMALDVPYYVKRDYNETVNDTRLIELEVEQRYVNDLTQACKELTQAVIKGITKLENCTVGNSWNFFIWENYCRLEPCERLDAVNKYLQDEYFKDLKHH